MVGAVANSLNPEQQEAAEVVDGPLAIVAGAGTGKTTTITHRIAHQVLSGRWQARELLAVTFTAKAAGVLRERLLRLGVRGVEARTFHAAALWQLGVLHDTYMGRPLEQILASKARVLQPLVSRLPAPYRFRPVREFAGEIEWAKNRRITREDYSTTLDALERTPPVPADIVDRIWRGYEDALARERWIDFEDVLERTIRLFDEHPEALARIQRRFQSFTVDEYQDVNPLQAALLDRWLGARTDLCVVGDDYQTIYGFTGADPAYLLGFAERFADARVVRLERNYRSTPEVLDLANRLAPQLGGFEKQLVASRASGPEPQLHRPADPGDEAALVARIAAEHHAAGTPYGEIAVLYRTNARSEPLELALASAHIPFQVKDGAFLQRPAARGLVQRLTRAANMAFGEAMQRALADLGFDPDSDAAGDERTRQDDLAQLRLLAHDYASGRERCGEPASGDGFVASLRERFTSDADTGGVQLMTLHRAKGLEFDCVILVGLNEGELPYKHRGVASDVNEERRLLYVGITRAREDLHLSAPLAAKPSRFLTELGLLAAVGTKRAASGTTATGRKIKPLDALEADAAVRGQTLKAWRFERAQTDDVPAYVVFSDATLAEIASAHPTTLDALASVSGVGPAKLERYGADVLELLCNELPV